MTEGDIAPLLGPIGSLIEKAYSYAELGLELFPANPRDKTPLTSQRQATTDLDTLEAWWTQWPTALIGYRPKATEVILDVDPRHGGLDTWLALKEEIGDAFPITRTHYSGRGDGGGHSWWQRPDDHLTITKLDAWAKERGLGQEIVVEGAKPKWVCGIDILHRNHRYSLLPPSLHPDTGQPYRWGKGKGLSTDIAPMPQLLVDLLVRDAEVIPPRPPSPRDPNSPADWFCETHCWSEFLRRHGWLLVGGDGESDGSRWRHPTSENRAHSATIRHGCLFVYSPNTPFDVTTDGEPHGYTLFKAWATLEHHGDMSLAARAARKLMPAATVVDSLDPKTNGKAASARRMVLTPAAAIRPKRVRWMWENRLAVGTLGLLAGPEGLGKSTLGYTIAADVTRGELVGEYLGQPRSVLVCATEDSWEHTIVPRLMASGADLDRVYRAEVMLADDIVVGLTLPLDLAELERSALEVDAALLMLDPLMSRLDGVIDTHKDGEVRRALEPLVSVADAAAMSILGLIHHNKSGSTDPLRLVMASKAFTAVARSVHTVIKDPDDETGLRKFFGTPKSNLGPIDLPTLSFTIAPWTYDTDDGPGTTGQLLWGPEYKDSIADILYRSAQDPEQRGALDEAADWLKEYMTLYGPKVFSGDAKNAGRASGHSQRTIERAQKRLGLTPIREGFPAKVYWVATDSPLSPRDLEVGEPGETGSEQGTDSPKTTDSPRVTLPTRARRDSGIEGASTDLIEVDQIEASDAFRRGLERASADRQTVSEEDLL